MRQCSRATNHKEINIRLLSEGVMNKISPTLLTRLKKKIKVVRLVRPMYDPICRDLIIDTIITDVLCLRLVQNYLAISLKRPRGNSVFASCYIIELSQNNNLSFSAKLSFQLI